MLSGDRSAAVCSAEFVLDEPVLSIFTASDMLANQVEFLANPFFFAKRGSR
jgi:hypothetical protein